MNKVEHNKEFIEYEQALEMKKLGFDDICYANMFDNSKEDEETVRISQRGVFDIKDSNRIRYFSFERGDNFNREFDFGVIGKKDLFVSIPLYQQAFRWFRKKYGLKSHIESIEYLDDTPDTCHWCIYNHCNSGLEQLTYEEAEKACLKNLIEVLKNKDEFNRKGVGN